MKRDEQGPLLHRADFLREIKAVFPQLREEFNAQQQSYFLEGDVFQKFIQSQINEGNREAVEQSWAILARFLECGNMDTRTVISLGILEHLSFEDGRIERSWAREIMPRAVRVAYDEKMES